MPWSEGHKVCFFNIQGHGLEKTNNFDANFVAKHISFENVIICFNTSFETRETKKFKYVCINGLFNQNIVPKYYEPQIE